MTHHDVLTQEQIDFYDTNGYLVVDNLFSHKECDALLTVLLRYADKNYADIRQLDWRVPEVRSIMKDSRIVCIVEILQSAVVDGVMTAVFFKKPGTPYVAQAFSAHQDASYSQADWGTSINTSLSLDHMDKENGGLYVHPGSHRQPRLLPFIPTKTIDETNPENILLNPGNVVEPPHQYEKVDLSIRKGSVLFIHGHVVHGSYANISETRSRPVCQVTYINQGADFISGKYAKRTRVSVHE